MQKKRLLIIEDEHTLAESLLKAMKKVGFEAQAVETGEEGIKKLEEETFDIILLDLYLPRENGIEVLKRLRKRKMETKVIVMTAYGSMETNIESIRLGASDYIYKSEGLLGDLKESLGRIFSE